MDEPKSSPYGHRDYRAQDTDETYPEKVLHIIAFAILVIGCVASIGCGASLMQNYVTEGLGTFILFFGVATSVITCFFLLVINNISKNIREMKKELRNRA